MPPDVTTFHSYVHTFYLYHFFFFFNDTATTEIYTLSLHDALPISLDVHGDLFREVPAGDGGGHLGDVAHLGGQVAGHGRSEEHTSELQSPCNIVCRLLLEKKKQRSIALFPKYDYK